MLKAIHAQEDRESAVQKARDVAQKIAALRLGKTGEILKSGIEETLSYYEFPVAHWRYIRTNNQLERLNREIRWRTWVVGSFPDGHVALMLVAARLRYMAGQKWGTQRHLRYSGMSQNSASTLRQTKILTACRIHKV